MVYSDRALVKSIAAALGEDMVAGRRVLAIVPGDEQGQPENVAEQHVIFEIDRPGRVIDDDENAIRLQDLFCGFVIDEEAQRIRRQADYWTRVTRQFLRHITNPFQMNDETFRHLYRLTPQRAITFVELLTPLLSVNTRTRIPIFQQVLILLRFLGFADFQRSVGQDFNHPVCQTLVSDIIERVLNAIMELVDDWIVFPSTKEEREATSARFGLITRIEKFLGIMDGFLVRILRPHEFEELYFNYKEGPSVNVQLVSEMHVTESGIELSYYDAIFLD
ncbi:hypothetical protein QAD02_007517 [Eretmocerus hayati]|uniref:Uncharacterized protein n=1 Tax=Eretmocerus hayati TaxID=131215 RepID=A0ACC2N3V6_9HYME|nr:hypothetical protein QAD02_007517 [Eretmocerus hayati]